jgi:thioredoxin-like negative regulator of GroEL
VFDFPVYFDKEQEAASAYGIWSIPTTLFIDKDGYIVMGMQGSIEAETLKKAIEHIK